EDDGEVMFIDIIQNDVETQNEDPNEGERAMTKETVVEYFDTFSNRNELTYHRKDKQDECFHRKLHLCHKVHGCRGY
ncbi:hypothetical protein Tco_0244536, partial [Tanacetum coccineum]